MEEKKKKTKLPCLLPVRCVLFMVLFAVGSCITGKELRDISHWWTIVATIVNIFTIVLLVFAAKKNGMTYGELIGYRKGSTKIRQIVLMSVLILVLGTGGMYLAGFLCYGVIPYASPMMIEPIPKILAILNFLPLPVTTALAEDGLYLGCGVNHIENKVPAIIIPAFFYALQHCFIPTLPDGRYVLYRFLSYLPLTIILCLYYHKKRNPVPVMIGHALIDMMTVSWVLATSLNPGFYEMMINM
ncbi:MAG: CPBP family intramembrane metalloprotease [Lachnospiraceae bacterium]|nr:CPBP family intramembrane metalloprotease [Lachnospiraceae bacterium]